MSKKPIKFSERKDGVRTVRCYSWKAFQSFMIKDVKYSEYIYRGQACSNWALSTSLDRAIAAHLRGKTKKEKSETIQQHLAEFKNGCRGRGVSSKCGVDEDEWWALGQHHGLYTPLLDWTTSPYVAAFFAFISQPSKATTQFRCIWSLLLPSVKKISEELSEKDKGKFFIPENDENSRLIAQGGMFSRIPIGIGLEAWVRKHFKGSPDVVLDKILIPETYRTTALTHLNRMHINHTRLFPDLGGAANSTNMKFEDPNY